VAAVAVDVVDEVDECPCGGVGWGDAGTEVGTEPCHAGGVVEADAWSEISGGSEDPSPFVGDLDVVEAREDRDEQRAEPFGGFRVSHR
jgi:hypothetical protein